MTGIVEEDFLEIDARSADEVAMRVLALHALASRLVIEQFASKGTSHPESDIDEMSFDLRVFIAESGIGAILSNDELTALDRPPGELSDDDLLPLDGSAQALVTLLSACGVIPPLDFSSSEPAPLPQDTDLDQETVQSLRQRLTIPADDRAAFLREIAELWLWRVESEIDIRSSHPAARRLLEQTVEEAAKEAMSAGLIQSTSKGDFATSGTPITEWNDEQLSVFLVTAAARLRALNWLCGFGEMWDDVPLYV
ncbi:MAG: hypothetical protein AB7V46_23255 [Thermomicrobiales bacterium]